MTSRTYGDGGDAKRWRARENGTGGGMRARASAGHHRTPPVIRTRVRSRHRRYRHCRRSPVLLLWYISASTITIITTVHIRRVHADALDELFSGLFSLLIGLLCGSLRVTTAAVAWRLSRVPLPRPQQPRLTVPSPSIATGWRNHARRKDAAAATMEGKLVTIGFYTIDRRIGKGNFAEVRLATHRLVNSEASGRHADVQYKSSHGRGWGWHVELEVQCLVC